MEASVVSKRRLLQGLGLAGIGAALAACNTLSLFNAMTPKEGNVHRIARNIAYGDDPRQAYDVYAPRNATTALPLLVFFYGGGWDSGSKDAYAWMAHSLASMGYVVALPDYRVVPNVHYPDFLMDCAAAVKHITGHAAGYGAEPARLALMGQSAGAYNAVMLALDPQYLKGTKVAAVVGISGPYDFYPFDVAASINAFGQWPRPEETQPVNHVRKLDTHFLLLQSRADTVVGTHNAVNLDKKLRAAGTEVRLQLYDRLSHQDTAAVFSIPFRGKSRLRADVQAFLKTEL